MAHSVYCVMNYFILSAMIVITPMSSTEDYKRRQMNCDTGTAHVIRQSIRRLIRAEIFGCDRGIQ